MLWILLFLFRYRNGIIMDSQINDDLTYLHMLSNAYKNSKSFKNFLYTNRILFTFEIISFALWERIEIGTHLCCLFINYLLRQLYVTHIQDAKCRTTHWTSALLLQPHIFFMLILLWGKPFSHTVHTPHRTAVAIIAMSMITSRYHRIHTIFL